MCSSTGCSHFLCPQQPSGGGGGPFDMDAFADLFKLDVPTGLTVPLGLVGIALGAPTPHFYQ